MTLAAVLTTRTEDDIFAADLVALAGLGLPATGWQTTAIQYAITKINARSQAAAELFRKRYAQAGYLDTVHLSGADWVDILSQGFFQVTRTPATFAIHQIRITDTSAGSALDKATRTVRLKHSGSGLYFINREAFHVDASGYADVQFVCESSGTQGNVAPSGTWEIITSLPGYTATNPAVGATGVSVLVAGADQETSASVVTRCRNKWSTLGRGGNAAAVAYRITEANSLITRYYINDANPNGPGSVDVYIAPASGTASGGQVTAMLASLNPQKAVGTGELRVIAAPLVAQGVTAILYTDGTNGSAQADADAAIAAMVPTQDPASTAVGLGGTLYIAQIIAALMSVDGAQNATVSLPAADVVYGNADAVTFTPSITVDP